MTEIAFAAKSGRRHGIFCWTPDCSPRFYLFTARQREMERESFSPAILLAQLTELKSIICHFSPFLHMLKQNVTKKEIITMKKNCSEILFHLKEIALSSWYVFSRTPYIYFSCRLNVARI